MRRDFDRFVERLPQATKDSVRQASILRTQGRARALGEVFGDRLEETRQAAASLKEDVLANLKTLLLRFEGACEASGTRVHWAFDAAEARQIVSEIVARRCGFGDVIVKGKSMATEEIGLNEHLAGLGYQVVETDLGEFVVQITDDTPSHIVTPIIHKTRFEVAAAFEREGLGNYTESPEELTLQARNHLREKFRSAKVGISGVNFAIADTGRLVIVENEGNNRLSTTAPDVHIALMGIEKLLPDEESLPEFLHLLAGSGVGQTLTTYVHFIQGPRRNDETDGPQEVHVVLLDNGRTATLNSPLRSILRCIRCGACLNACPVYREGSGHAYGHVYSGPLGAIMAPMLGGVETYGQLARASTLCGRCESVCPVAIPIPSMLLELRRQGTDRKLTKNLDWRPFVVACKRLWIWKSALALLRWAPGLAFGRSGWTKSHRAPEAEGREFRRWWNERS